MRPRREVLLRPYTFLQPYLVKLAEDFVRLPPGLFVPFPVGLFCNVLYTAEYGRDMLLQTPGGSNMLGLDVHNFLLSAWTAFAIDHTSCL
jgi:hypothetical protein